MHGTWKVGWMGLGLLVLLPAALFARSSEAIGQEKVLGKAAVAVHAAPTAKPARTIDNLQAAYDGESNAQAKYAAFAKQAEKEGYLKVAKLFTAVAMSEGLHAAKHANVIKAMGAIPKTTLSTPKVGTTQENLAAGLKGENAEIETMYPEFIKQAEAEKNSQASMSFLGAKNVEAVHAKLFSEALANLETWKAVGDFYVCQVCGNVVAQLDFQYCPICKAPVQV